MNDKDRAAYLAEAEFHRTQAAEISRKRELIQTPEYKAFATHADKVGMRNPERRVAAFESFKASGETDAAAYVRQAQNTHINAGMNAFLRSK